MKRGLWFFWFMVSFSPSYGFVIQGVSGPDCAHANPLIRRYSVHVDVEKDEVIYGTCAPTEVTCLPNSETYIVKRSMPYNDYQKHLANLFNVDPRFLKNEDKQHKNFQSIIETLRQIINSPESTDEAKKEARGKLAKLTEKGGVVERFNHSRAIKMGLQWDPEHPEQHSAVFEKSRKQFAQALYPFNFVSDKKPLQANVTFEPTTENTWWYAGKNMTFAEAYRICGTVEGYRMPTKEELELAVKWIPSTPFGAEIPATSEKDARKSVWLAERTTEHYKDREEEKFLYEGQLRPSKVNVYLWRVIFNYATIGSSGTASYSTAVISTGLETEPLYSNLINDYGSKTARMSAICVLNPEKL